jgi:hypothetical protein
MLGKVRERCGENKSTFFTLYGLGKAGELLEEEAVLLMMLWHEFGMRDMTRVS